MLLLFWRCLRNASSGKIEKKKNISLVSRFKLPPARFQRESSKTIIIRSFWNQGARKRIQLPGGDHAHITDRSFHNAADLTVLIMGSSTGCSLQDVRNTVISLPPLPVHVAARLQLHHKSCHCPRTVMADACKLRGPVLHGVTTRGRQMYVPFFRVEARLRQWASASMRRI